MRLEQQVCSLELAKKLKELGVKQESLFYCVIDLMGGGLENELKYGEMPEDHYSWSFASAFTVAELGEILKKHGNFISGYGLDTEKEYYCTRVSLPEFEIWSENFVEADTEADARAKMLVYLLENKLISL